VKEEPEPVVEVPVVVEEPVDPLVALMEKAVANSDKVLGI
jgi:hypothetical protein